mmetsp:Transcript_15024/g.30709  ORF Transcript_15024/g.30709 Transcript_15024/m.30709 type:complete len:203 (-) Transcript_15024:384-992(-)
MNAGGLAKVPSSKWYTASTVAVSMSTFWTPSYHSAPGSDMALVQQYLLLLLPGSNASLMVGNSHRDPPPTSLRPTNLCVPSGCSANSYSTISQRTRSPLTRYWSENWPSSLRRTAPALSSGRRRLCSAALTRSRIAPVPSLSRATKGSSCASTTWYIDICTGSSNVHLNFKSSLEWTRMAQEDPSWSQSNNVPNGFNPAMAS